MKKSQQLQYIVFSASILSLIMLSCIGNVVAENEPISEWYHSTPSGHTLWGKTGLRKYLPFITNLWSIRLLVTWDETGVSYWECFYEKTYFALWGSSFNSGNQWDRYSEIWCQNGFFGPSYKIHTSLAYLTGSQMFVWYPDSCLTDGDPYGHDSQCATNFPSS